MSTNMFERPQGPSSNFRTLYIPVVKLPNLEFTERALWMQDNRQHEAPGITIANANRAGRQVRAAAKEGPALGALAMSIWTPERGVAPKPNYPLEAPHGYLADAGYGFAYGTERGVVLGGAMVARWAQGSSVSAAVTRTLLQQFDPHRLMAPLQERYLAPGDGPEVTAEFRSALDAVPLLLNHAFEGQTTRPPRLYAATTGLTVGDVLDLLPQQFPDLPDMAIVSNTSI